MVPVRCWGITAGALVVKDFSGSCTWQEFTGRTEARPGLGSDPDAPRTSLTQDIFRSLRPIPVIAVIRTSVTQPASGNVSMVVHRNLLIPGLLGGSTRRIILCNNTSGQESNGNIVTPICYHRQELTE